MSYSRFALVQNAFERKATKQGIPSDTSIEIAGKKGMRLRLVELSEIFIASANRSHTLPSVFSGNRFEFRALGSSINGAGTLTLLNVVVVELVKLFKSSVDQELTPEK